MSYSRNVTSAISFFDAPDGVSQEDSEKILAENVTKYLSHDSTQE